MKKYLEKAYYRQFSWVLLLALVVSGLNSCKDIYPLDNEEPDFLGGSIYEYLEKDGHYTNYLNLINDLNYGEVLKRTGSKTLFVAKDSSFTEFFKSNEWNVSSYSQLTIAQKKLLFNYSIINNAYTTDMYSNYNSGDILYEGTAMRRKTALENIDSVCFEVPDYIPVNPYWTYYKTRGIYLIKDVSLISSIKNIPTVFITQSFMDKYSLTDEDFSLLTNGKTRLVGDMHVFDSKVIKKNIRCKNGFVHLLDNVLIPHVNMSEYINRNSDTKIFSKLIERFSFPIFDAANTLLYKQLHPTFSDSIFSKAYYASNGGYIRYINGVAQTNILPYNPGWNTYSSSSPLQADMAAMFVPSDKAMTDYFNSGVGAILKSRFGTWENVPDEIVLPFIKRHMRTSLIESVPSKFSKMVDGENYTLPVQKSHIEKSYMGVNGQVFVTNTIYPPVDYISVYSPVLMSSNSKIMNWAINISQLSVDNTPFAFYKLYLNSLVSKYSLFIPTDDYFNKYIDPIAYGQDVQGVLKYWLNTKTSAVNATVYKYDKNTGVIGDSVNVITSESFLKNRLWDLLDSHIVIGDVEATGSRYAVTKANDIIRVSGSGSTLTVQGGNDILTNKTAHTTKFFPQYNGNTYFIDKPIEPALRSVYKVLSETPEFSMFIDLLKGVPQDYVSQIFAQQGIDYRVKFFNAFRYTIYVPTNEAIQKAIDAHRIKTWDEINAITEVDKKTAAIEKMVRMLKYHFQDNAVFTDQTINDRFQSSTIKTDTVTTYWKTAKTKYYKIGIVGDGNTLHLTADTQKGAPACVANVTTDNNLRNIIVKDYIFAALPSKYKNVDGTGNLTGTAFSSSTITSSASAVIHQIDNVLTIEQ